MVFFLVLVLFFILGLVIYPAGWSSNRVRRVCGENAEAFFLADCSLGDSWL